MRQTMGYPEQSVPVAPPVDMLSTEGLTPQDVDSAMLGTNVLLHLEEGEYAPSRHTYLMPPLTGVCTPTRRSAGMPSSSRARAADITSTSRAGTSRGGVRLVPPILPTYHHDGWPDIPTELTGWRYGTSYSIPIEPPMPGHRYVRDPDSPPVCFTALIYHSDTWTFIHLLMTCTCICSLPVSILRGCSGLWPHLRAWSCGERPSCPSSVSRYSLGLLHLSYF